MNSQINSLNKLYNNSCKIKYNSYQKITNDIVLIDNFFENFNSARNFFISRDKWRCTSYSKNSNPGYESIFPLWVGKSLIDTYLISNNLTVDIYSFSLQCNFFYHQSDFVWSITNSTYFPHVDATKTNNILNYICLVNLNLLPVSTKFYTFRGNQFCDSKNEEEWIKYTKKMEEELLKYYNKNDITNDEIKLFLDSKKELDVKLIKTVKYKPNQAIVYPAHLFHSPDVTPEFTKDNPRILLRISFDCLENKTIKMINYH